MSFPSMNAHTHIHTHAHTHTHTQEAAEKKIEQLQLESKASDGVRQVFLFLFSFFVVKESDTLVYRIRISYFKKNVPLSVLNHSSVLFLQTFSRHNVNHH